MMIFKKYSLNPEKWARLRREGRLVVTATLVLQNRWHMHMIKLTPRERFIEFFHDNPKLIQRVSQKYLASFLNIKPETFSRFKHLLKDHAKKKSIEMI